MSKGESQLEITSALASLVGNDADDLQSEYTQFHEWMVTKGLNPVREIPLKDTTAENYFERLDQAHRLIIQYLEPDNPVAIRHDHADDFVFLLNRDEIRKRNGDEYSESAKRKFANAVQKYFEWQYDIDQQETPWRPQIVFSQTHHTSAYKFQYREFGKLIEAAQTYGSLPSYYESSPEERDRVDGLVAQRLGISKDEVARDDWIRADSSRKVYSLVTVGYDAGLTPIEIAAAEVGWYDPHRKVLKIPTEKACKQREKEVVALSDATVDGLSEWIQERRHLEKYDGTSKLWLNREGNPYQSGSLCRLLRKLCEQAGIETDGQAIRWYSLRHTMGRNVTEEGELSEANDQLRHEHLETTKQNYDETPIEKLQNRLNATHEKAGKAAADPDYNPFAEDGQEREASRTPSEDSSSSQRGDSVVTSTNGGNIHVDAVIPDTTESRVDVTREILDNTEQR